MGISKLKLEFGKRLRNTRIRRGYETATAFARLLGEESNTVTMWERGDRYPPPYQLHKVILLLRVTADYLLFGYVDGLTTEAVKSVLGETSLYSDHLENEGVA